ncbi:MAG TPA: ADYC domain-containing protein [Caulobacter sp.]|nr:ADYC domain-containing protein [Caulobacter sp.]
MIRRLIHAAALALVAVPALAAEPVLTVEGSDFVLTTPDGRLTSADMAGVELDLELEGTPLTLRIASATPAEGQPHVLLLDLQVRGADGKWAPLCDADAYGRRLGFPVAGRWAPDGSYIRDPNSWFLTCTSGSQGKCILWGYDPWRQDKAGRPLDRHYQACQQMVRADYDGRGEPHTRDGTTIDMQDDIGLQKWDSVGDPEFGFEAGWGPDGAVCVARTRWPDLLKAEDLWKANPRLAGDCTPETARAKGALLFTRVKIK